MLMVDRDRLSETERAFVSALLLRAPKLADAIAVAVTMNIGPPVLMNSGSPPVSLIC